MALFKCVSMFVKHATNQVTNSARAAAIESFMEWCQKTMMERGLLKPLPVLYQMLTDQPSNLCSQPITYDRLSATHSPLQHSTAQLLKDELASARWHMRMQRTYSTQIDQNSDQPSDVMSEGTGRQPLAKIEPRVGMIFTCINCDTRAVKTFSKRSYEKGFVMVRCPGCQKHHLVADHLGWFGDKGWTVEDLANELDIRVKSLLDKTQNSDAAPSTDIEQLTAADWLGWSRVEDLLKVSHDKQMQVSDNVGTASEEARSSDTGVPAGNQNQDNDAQAASSSSSSSSTDGINRQAAEQALKQGLQQAGSDVWELGPEDMERWQRVQQAKAAEHGQHDTAQNS